MTTLSPLDERNYRRTGILNITPEKIEFLGTALNDDQTAFLNGKGEFVKVAGGGTGGTTSMIDVSYAELVSLINSSGLTPTQVYKLTDYRTVHYMFDKDVRLDDINTGELEHLILTANNINSFYPEVYSLEYPQDIIHYDWKSDYWIQDIAFATAENISGSTMNPDLTNVTLIPNYKGVIYRRNDTKNNVILGYDFRNVKFRRWKFNYPIWNSGTTYTLQEKIQIPSDGVYVSLVSGNTNNLVTNTDNWLKIIDYIDTEYWCISSAESSNQNDFIDVNTFHGFDQWNNYDVSVKNVIINSVNDTYTQFWGYVGSSLSNTVFYLGGNTDTQQTYTTLDINADILFELNTIGNNFYQNNIGFYFSNNIIGSSSESNIIGNQFNGNIIENQFKYNIIGNLFDANMIGVLFSNSSICDNFMSNIIGNTFSSNNIGNNFSANAIRNGFGSNTIESNFKYNIIGNFGVYNTIGNNCIFNTFYDNLRSNTIKNNFDGSGVDFSSATHIYNFYNCDLFRTPNGTTKLSYCDDSGVIQVVNANA